MTDPHLAGTDEHGPYVLVDRNGDPFPFDATMLEDVNVWRARPCPDVRPRPPRSQLLRLCPRSSLGAVDGPAMTRNAP